MPGLRSIQLLSRRLRKTPHQDIPALRESLSRLRDAVENSDAATREARNFYELVASASKNLVLGFLVNALHRMSEGSHVEYDPERWRASVEQSEKVLHAIERGDAESARTISTKALDAAMRYLGMIWFSREFDVSKPGRSETDFNSVVIR